MHDNNYVTLETFLSFHFFETVFFIIVPDVLDLALIDQIGF